MRSRSIWSWVLLTFFVVLPLVLAANLAVEPQHVARGKAATLPLSDEMDAEQELAQALALADERVQGYTTGQRTEVFGVQTISHQFNPATVECNDADCRQVNIFNFDESATIAAIVNLEREQVLDVLYQPGIRPGINKRLADLALEIATSAPEVIEVLGHQAVNSDWAPMDSTLVGSACQTGNMCVAPTFDLGDYILWAIVDLTDETFVELFWTSTSVDEEARAIPYPDAYQEKVEGCEAMPGSHSQGGWNASWETTAHDGFHVFDVTYNDVEVLTSAKLVEWHADYGNSGYQDSVGCSGGGGGFTIYPYGDTQVLDMLDGDDNVIGFELMQDFRMGGWGGFCGYRYEQHLQFFNDGRYRVVAGAFGKGCGDNSLYRPLMRIDVAVEGDDNDNLEVWDENQEAWTAQTTEYVFGAESSVSPEGYAWRVSDQAGAGYYIEPARGQFEADNYATDYEFFYAVQFNDGEGDGDLGVFGVGCCDDEQHGPEIYVNDESIENQNLVLWYVPQFQTQASAPDYTCWTVAGEPNPETYPCFGGPMFVPVSVGIQVDDGNDGAMGTGEPLTFSAPPASDQADYLWDFDDGNSSPDQNPTHTYSQAGTYNVELEVTEPDLRSSQGITIYNMTITVLESANAAFSHENLVATGADVAFSNSSTGEETLTYLWDFGDENSSTDENPTHAYAEAGSYDVVLIVSNDFSTDTMSSSVSVIEAASASFAHDDMVPIGADVAFSNNSMGGGSLSYLWDFADGMTSTDEAPSHSYSEAGTYQVSLTVSNEVSSDTMSSSVSVIEAASASFTHDDMVATGADVAFSNNSMGGGTMTYLWNFADGMTSTDEAPSHSYDEAGTYQVSLSVSNEVSSDTMSSTISVMEAVVAGFTHNAPVEAGNAVEFTNASTGGGTMTYMWDFGDDNTSDEANPSYTYSEGTYEVTLTVSNEVSSDSYSQSVEIVSIPTAVTVNVLNAQHNDQSMILLWGLGSLLAMGIALTRIYVVEHEQ